MAINVATVCGHAPRRDRRIGILVAPTKPPQDNAPPVHVSVTARLAIDSRPVRLGAATSPTRSRGLSTLGRARALDTYRTRRAGSSTHELRLRLRPSTADDDLDLSFAGLGRIVQRRGATHPPRAAASNPKGLDSTTGSRGLLERGTTVMRFPLGLPRHRGAAAGRTATSCAFAGTPPSGHRLAIA